MPPNIPRPRPRDPGRTSGPDHVTYACPADSEPGVADLLERFDVDADDDLCEQLEQLTASYFLEQKTDKLEPLDPVARVHLKNGAVLERINPRLLALNPEADLDAILPLLQKDGVFPEGDAAGAGEFPAPGSGEDPGSS